MAASHTSRQNKDRQSASSSVTLISAVIVRLSVMGGGVSAVTTLPDRRCKPFHSPGRTSAELLLRLSVRII